VIEKRETRKRFYALAALGALALTTMLAPASAGRTGEGEIRAGSPRAGLLIPAKTKLIIAYSRIALA
jgi:hypothetical protein